MAEQFATIRQLLETQVAAFPEKEFLFSEADGRIFTYRAFDEAVNQAANLLLAAGIEKGKRVSLFLTNSAEYLIFYFACFKIGAWAGPINAHLKAEEIEFVVTNSEASVIVTQQDLLPKVEAVRDHLATVREVLLIDDTRAQQESDSRLQTPDSRLFPSE